MYCIAFACYERLQSPLIISKQNKLAFNEYILEFNLLGENVNEEWCELI